MYKGGYDVLLMLQTSSIARLLDDCVQLKTRVEPTRSFLYVHITLLDTSVNNGGQSLRDQK